MFGLNVQDLRVINYSAMLVFKMLAVCFLFYPFVAIETAIRSIKKGGDNDINN